MENVFTKFCRKTGFVCLCLLHLLPDNLLDLGEGYRGETVVVNPDVVLRRKKHAEARGILADVVLAGMHMPEKLPGAVESTIVAQERIMVQVYLLPVNIYQHLVGNRLESAGDALPEIPVVVIAQNKIYPAVQPVQDPVPFGSTAQTEIAEMKDNILRPHYTVPVRDHGLVHLSHILKRPVAEGDYTCMAEMRIRRKKYLVPIEPVNHAFHIECPLYCLQQICSR